MKSNARIYTWTGITLIVLCMVALFFLRPGGVTVSDGGIKCRVFSESVSRQQGEYIEEIVQTLSNTATFSLLFKKGRLRSLGAKLDGKVPSFEFLGYIFSHPALAKDMANVKKSAMKYNNFVKGLQESFLEDYQNGCLFTRGAAFAKYLGLPKEKIQEILQSCVEAATSKDDDTAFRPLVDYLIKEKA